MLTGWGRARAAGATRRCDREWDGSQHLRLTRQFDGPEEIGHRLLLAGHGRHAGHRRETQLRAFGQLPYRVADGVPPHQGLHGPQCRLGDDDHGAALLLRPHQRGGRDPAPQRVLARPQVGPREHGPAVQQQRGRVTALGDRLGARCAHHERGRARHRVQHVLAPRGPHRHGGKGPPQLLCGPPGPDDLGTQPERAALRAVPGGFLPPAPPAPRRPGVLCLQGPGAVPAARGLPAARAGHPRHIAPAGHLHQHGPVPQSLPGRLPGERRQPRGPGGLVAREVAVAHGAHERSRPPHLLPRRDQRPGPAALDELCRLHRAAPTSQQETALVLRGAQQQHLSDVRLRRVLLAVAVVPVVPERHQPEIPHRCEHGRPRPQHGPHGAPAHRQPLPVPLLGPRLGGEQRVPSLAQDGGQRGVHPGGGPPVRYDHERAPSRGQRGGDRAGQLLAPLGPGQRVPHGTRRAAPGQRLQEGRPPLVPGPGARVGRGRRRQRCGGGPLLGPGAARRHSELQDVGDTARVPVGDGPREAQQLLAEHGFGRHDLGERGQRSGVVRLGPALDQVPVDEAAALAPPLPHPVPSGPETHPHPHPGLRVGVQLGRHRVIEVPVEVQHALVDQHPRHGQFLGERGPPPGPRLGPGFPGLAHALPDERELLRRRPRGPAVPRTVLAAHACILTKRD